MATNNHPLNPFMPSAEHVRQARVERQSSLTEARNHFIRRNMAEATDAAKTVEELRVVVRALVFLHRFER